MPCAEPRTPWVPVTATTNIEASARFPPNDFKRFLTLFSECFSSFPRGTSPLLVSRSYLALDGVYHLIEAAFSSNPTLEQRSVVRQHSGSTGLSPSRTSRSRELFLDLPLESLSETTTRGDKPPDYQLGLFPFRSPLLGES